MSQMPQEPEAFAECVASMLHRMQPETEIDLGGPNELVIDGRRLDLENLYRMVAQDQERGTEIVEHYLDQLFTGETYEITDVSFSFAKPRIMPRIQPVSIFQHLSRELVAHVPWINNTVIVFVTDLPNMTVSITTEQLVRWGVTADDLDEIARANLDSYAQDLTYQFIESKEGGRAVIITEQDGYDAARILMSDLHNRLAPELGGNFFVAAPARDMFVAFSPNPDPFVGRIHSRVTQDFSRLPYPITPDLFLVTRDGVAGSVSSDEDLGWQLDDNEAA